MDDYTIEELQDIISNLEKAAGRYRGVDPNFHTGDQGYQDYLEEISEYEDMLEELEKLDS